jgi:hypothetical protein
MFQRQAFGYVNPFQTLAGGINPFVQHAGLSPFQQFAGGINPFLQQPTPLQIPGLMSPYHPLAGGIAPFHPLSTGFNPWLNQVPGIAPQLGAAFGIGAQPPFVTPGFGVPPVIAGLGVSPLAAQCGYGTGAVNPYAGQIGAFGGINPQAVDPTVALMLAQQQNPVSQHLPIRSLVGQNPLEHFQGNPIFADPTVALMLAQQQNPIAQHLAIRLLAGQNPLEQFQGIGGNPTFGQAVDPYTALINAQLVSHLASHLATSPIHQLIRSQIGSPYGWGGTPFPVANPVSPTGI